MSEANVLVLTGYGLNCDYETAYAFELAGARAERVHINALIEGRATLENYQILIVGLIEIRLKIRDRIDNLNPALVVGPF